MVPVKRLTLNKKKTKLMVFGTRSKIKKSSDVTVKIGNEKLQLVPSFKYLGVVLDSALTYSNHVKSVINTVVQKSYLLGKIRKYITSDTAILIFKSRYYRTLIMLMLSMPKLVRIIWTNYNVYKTNVSKHASKLVPGQILT